MFFLLHFTDVFFQYLCWVYTLSMPDNHTPDQRHRNMAAVRSASTNPEMKLRRALWHHGFRYIVNDKRLPGSPDIVLPKYHTAIFVHGCFWHGHMGCKKYSVPKTNTEFWETKVAMNQNRDQEVWRNLEAKGWSVVIVWECQLKKVNFDETINRVASEIIRDGEAYRAFKEERRKAQKEYRLVNKAKMEREKFLLDELKKY